MLRVVKCICNRHSGSVVERPLCDREVTCSIPGRIIRTKDFKKMLKTTLSSKEKLVCFSLFAFRLLEVSLFFAFRLSEASLLFAFRLSEVSLLFAFRLSEVSLLFAFRFSIIGLFHVVTVKCLST